MRQYCSQLEIFARKSLHNMKGNRDAATGVPYFWTFLLSKPASFRHDAWDFGDGMGRRLDGMVCCRMMTGDTSASEIEKEYREKIYGLFGPPHGLLWRPQTSYCDRSAEMMDQSSSIFPVVTEFLETGSGRAEATIETLARGLLAIAVRDGKGLHFPLAFYYPAGWVRPQVVGQGPMDNRQDDTWLEGDPAYYARIIIPMVKFWEVTGSPTARTLVEGLAHYLVYQSNRFAADGSFSRTLHGPKSVWTNGHCHSRFAAIAGLLRAGRLLEHEDYVEFARRAYHWGLTKGTNFGWFPEFVGRSETEEGCETCTITDAIDAALQLALLGETDYYEHVERYTTNQLVESQVWDVEFARGGASHEGDAMNSYDDVANRSIGGFAGWSAPNDLISEYPDPGFAPDGDRAKRRTLMDCCCGQGNRGLYLAWLHAVTQKAQTITVNMLISRRTPELTLESGYPQNDTVRLQMHADREVAVRIPGWVGSRAITATLNGKTKLNPEKRGRYLHLGKLSAGARVDLVFPPSDRTETATTGEEGIHVRRAYAMKWRGDRIIGVSPAGCYSPLYNHRMNKADAPQPPSHLPGRLAEW